MIIILKSQIEIVLGKSEKFDELMTAATTEYVGDYDEQS